MPQTDWLKVTIQVIQKDVAEIKTEVKNLNKAHWISQGKTIGIAAVVSFLVTLLGIFLAHG